MLSSKRKRTRIAEKWVGPRVEFVAMALGAASFVMEELMHFLLVPNIGRHWERLLAEVISAVVVGWLAALLMKAVNRHRAAILLRMQVISEMNEHVRTALDEISLTTQTIENQQCIRKISESMGHIEWALREVLLRPLPLPEVWGERRVPSKVHASAKPED